MNETKMSFTDDQKAVLLKALKDIQYANGQLYGWVKNDQLTEEMSRTLPTLIESYFSEAAKLLNYESHLLSEKENRHVEIRKANETIRELKEKLGSNKSVDGLQEQLKVLSNKVRDWWNAEGFNHVTDYKFDPYGGYHVKFSFMLDMRRSRLSSKTPVTDIRKTDEHVQYLRDRGFQFADFEDDRSEKLKLIDNQNNRLLLTEMLKERFPSIKIESWDNKSSYSNDDIFIIWHVDAYIYDLGDI